MNSLRKFKHFSCSFAANSLKMIPVRLSYAFIFLGVISYSKCGFEMDSDHANEFSNQDKSVPFHNELQMTNELSSPAHRKKFVSSLVNLVANAVSETIGNRRSSFDEEDLESADFHDALAMRNELAASVPKKVAFPLIRLILKGISKGAAGKRSHSDVHDYTANEVLKKVGVSQAVLENSEDVSMKTLVRALKKAAELFGNNLRNGKSGQQSGIRREVGEPEKLEKCTDGSKRKSMALSLPKRRCKNCKTIKRQRDQLLTLWRQCVKERDDIKINAEIDKKNLINNLENCKSKLNECNTSRSNSTTQGLQILQVQKIPQFLQELQ